MIRGLRPAAAAIALLALAGPAGAQQQKKPPTYVTPPPPLRGPVAPPPVTERKPPATTAAPGGQEAQPASPALRQALPPRPDTTARIGGLEPERSGGAQCRSACAQTYYFCLANQEGESCQASWSQCLIACPTNSSSF